MTQAEIDKIYQQRKIRAQRLIFDAWYKRIPCSCHWNTGDHDDLCAVTHAWHDAEADAIHALDDFTDGDYANLAGAEQESAWKEFLTWFINQQRGA